MFGGMGYPEGNRMMDRQIDDGMGVICRRRNDDFDIDGVAKN